MNSVPPAPNFDGFLRLKAFLPVLKERAIFRFLYAAPAPATTAKEARHSSVI